MTDHLTFRTPHPPPLDRELLRLGILLRRADALRARIAKRLNARLDAVEKAQRWTTWRLV